jgi:hypothetical protein
LHLQKGCIENATLNPKCNFATRCNSYQKLRYNSEKKQPLSTKTKVVSFQLNPPCRVGEIIFDDEIPFGDEIRLDGGWVDLISSAKQISSERSEDADDIQGYALIYLRKCTIIN